jgi:SAM-dependent methyltransferase
MIEAPVATDYTLDFVLGNLPENAHDILEVGFGEGELAAALAKRGLGVVALDANDELVAAAQARGVDARFGEWPVLMEQRFDAVLFTRSLHHIHPLDEAIAAARDALRPGGRIIVEDFRAEGGTARSRAWFTGIVRLLHAGCSDALPFDLDAMLSKAEPDGQEHDLHPSTAIATALAKVGRTEADDAAYYFRYLEPEFPPGATGALLDDELSLIANDSIDALGRRFVVTLDGDCPR